MKTIPPPKNSPARENREIKKGKPFVSLVIPAYNEEMFIKKNLRTLCEYMASLEAEYFWELIIVNDGSTDRTGSLAETFAIGKKNMHVFHHAENFGLGEALRTAFEHCQGDYVVTMDLDLSYSPDHIKKLLDEIQKPHAKIVTASPYMKGGKITNIPFFRKICSRTVNWFLSLMAPSKIHTLTSMARAYEGTFLKTLDLKAMDTEINPEIIYKALMLRVRILEVPAHLDWSFQKSSGKKRRSNIKMLRGIILGLMSGFIFRPYMFFMFVGFLLFLVALYIIIWIIIHVIRAYPDAATTGGFFDDSFSAAVASVFRERPYAFFIGGITLIVAFQFLISGILSIQNKRYFEELFHLNTSIFKHNHKFWKKSDK